MNATEHRIDDQDRSIDYSEQLLGLGGQDWSTNGGPNEYMNTASLTHKRGASAKLTFTGSFVAVYGIVSPSSSDSGTTSRYSIDGSTSGTYITKPLKTAQYDVEFFQSDTLQAGQHTLEVVNETEDGWLWLDYFLVSEGAANSTSTASATASTTSSTAPILSTSSTPSSTTVLPSSASSTSTSTVYVGAPSPGVTVSSDASGATSGSHRGPPAGVVVGAISGALFGITLLSIIIWLIRRKLADRFADQAAMIPTYSSSNTHKLALADPNMIEDHSQHELKVPAGDLNAYSFGAAVDRAQRSPHYQNYALQLPPSAAPQLQPRSRTTSHIPRPDVIPCSGPTQTESFCAGNQRQSSYIPPPVYSGLPGSNV